MAVRRARSAVAMKVSRSLSLPPMMPCAWASSKSLSRRDVVSEVLRHDVPE